MKRMALDKQSGVAMLNGEKQISRPLRWGMIGGGRLSQPEEHTPELK